MLHGLVGIFPSDPSNNNLTFFSRSDISYCPNFIFLNTDQLGVFLAWKVSKTYDLIFCDFDQEVIVQHLKTLVKHQLQAPQVFRPASNTSSVLEAWFQKQPCGEETHI